MPARGVRDAVGPSRDLRHSLTTLHQEIQMKHITVWNLPPGQAGAVMAAMVKR
jgi:hypothetical protein